MKTIDKLVLDENHVLFYPMMGNSYQLNSLGSDIIILLKEHKSKDEIIDALVERYKVSRHDIFIDVSDFFAKMKVYGLL